MEISAGIVLVPLMFSYIKKLKCLIKESYDVLQGYFIFRLWRFTQKSTWQVMYEMDRLAQKSRSPIVSFVCKNEVKIQFLLLLVSPLLLSVQKKTSMHASGSKKWEHNRKNLGVNALDNPLRMMWIGALKFKCNFNLFTAPSDGSCTTLAQLYWRLKCIWKLQTKTICRA